MKKRIALLISAVMILALFAIPASAADKVYNLIDESGATWTDTEVQSNKITSTFEGGKLILTAPGPWPNVESALKTPLSLKESDDASVNVKFTVEAAGAVSSVRLVSGTGDAKQYIWLHDFIKDAPLETGSGDIEAGSYELSAKLFDLKMFDALVDGKSTSKDLVLVDGALVIDGIQLWCSGTGPITVTVEKFEIVVPGKGGSTPTPSKPVNVAAGKSYTLFGLYADPNTDVVAYPDESGKDLTDGKLAEAAGYGDAAFVGFNIGAKDMVAADNSRISEIVVDLGAKENLTKFVLNTLTADGGISAPKAIKVYVSDDKTTWTEVGDLAYNVADVTAAAQYVATLEKTASGRYVKFASEHETNWVFVDEVEVYNAGSADGTPTTSDYGVIGFAVIALISLAGAALVSKKRA